MITRKKSKRRSYWKATEVSDLLMELYTRAYRYNPHGFEILRNRFNSKSCLVLTVNLFYSKDPSQYKIVKWHTREYDTLTDLMLYNIIIDL